MTATPIVLASARRRFGDAALLAFSTAFSVMAIGVFTAAAASQAVAQATSARQSLAGLFTSASVVTALFAVLSGWFFAEHYLSRRKREVATWLLVGMRRRAAFGLLSAEFAATGLFAFLSGTAAGLLLSRLFGLALAALMRERSPVPMAYGMASVSAGAVACLFQFLLAGLRSMTIVSRISIADLMRSERQAESPPKSRPFLAALGACLVLAGYAAAIFSPPALAIILMLPVLVSTVAGTFLCFEALVPTLAGMFRKRHKSGASNLVAMAQIAFRSRRNARLLALSAVLVAVAATAAGTVLAINTTDETSTGRTCPNDVELAKATATDMAAVDTALQALAKSGSPRSTGTRLAVEYLSLELPLLEGRSFPTAILPWSAWSKVMALRGAQPLPLRQGSFLSTMSAEELGDAAVSLRVSAGGQEAVFSAFQGKVAPALSFFTAGDEVILSDLDFERLLGAAETKNRETAVVWGGVDPDLARSALPSLHMNRLYVRAVMLDTQYGEYGALLFIGIFLAAVFVLCAVSMLLFRVTEDARDDRDRYKILRELGASRKLVIASLVRQDLFSFGLPLLFGMGHCIAALVMLRNISQMDNLVPTLIVAAATLPIFLLVGAAALRRQLVSAWDDPVAT